MLTQYCEIDCNKAEHEQFPLHFPGTAIKYQEKEMIAEIRS